MRFTLRVPQEENRVKHPKMGYNTDLKRMYQAVRFGNSRETTPMRRATIPEAVLKARAQGPRPATGKGE